MKTLEEIYCVDLDIPWQNIQRAVTVIGFAHSSIGEPDGSPLRLYSPAWLEVTKYKINETMRELYGYTKVK